MAMKPKFLVFAILSLAIVFGLLAFRGAETRSGVQNATNSTPPVAPVPSLPLPK